MSLSFILRTIHDYRHDPRQPLTHMRTHGTHTGYVPGYDGVWVWGMACCGHGVWPLVCDGV